MKYINHQIIVTMYLLLLTFSANVPAQSRRILAELPTKENMVVPDQFKETYHELDSTLQRAIQIYPFRKGDHCPLVAPNLYMAASFNKPAMSDLQRWKDILAILDAFKAMKINAIQVQITAPDLVWGDTVSLINFYQHLAREIHSRNMKLYIEHFVNIPFDANLPSRQNGQKFTGPTNDPHGRQDFLKILEQEVSMIYCKIKPDYLSLLTEPGLAIIRSLHLSFSSDELANWVGEIATRLKDSGLSPNTLLGAGALTYEPESFVLKFAQQKSLDYIDFHFYSLNIMGADQLTQLSNLIRKIRENRPELKITIGEAWLLKHGKDISKTPIQEVFFRDNFSFWSPLDQKFLNLMMGMAQKENIAVLVPYFSQYFFSYYTFGNRESGKLPPWPASTKLSWNKAIEAVYSNQLSDTGKTMSSMLEAVY
ncbi:MAG TPA: hypothetical protein VIH57_23950 [Bacteroidales bacterium]